MFWHTIDGGDRWQIVSADSHIAEIETVLPVNAPENVIAAARHGDSVWVQTADGACSGKQRDTVGPIVCSVANGFLRSADGGATWLSFEP
jgi:cytochrome c551/c552